MSPDAPKRRFRFSLITLLVAVNVAGVLVWLNWRRVAGTEPDLLGWNSTPTVYKGWPLAYDGGWWGFSILNFSVDVVVASLCLILSASITEYLVRRLRQAKRHDG